MYLFNGVACIVLLRCVQHFGANAIFLPRDCNRGSIKVDEWGNEDVSVVGLAGSVSGRVWSLPPGFYVKLSGLGFVAFEIALRSQPFVRFVV